MNEKIEALIDKECTYDFAWIIKQRVKTANLITKYQVQILTFMEAQPDQELNYNSDSILLYCPRRTVLMDFLKAFGGKWDKQPDDDGKIHYMRVEDGITIKACSCEAPPSCKVEEYEVEEPAIPARMVTKHRLVCPQKDEAQTEVASA